MKSRKLSRNCQKPPIVQEQARLDIRDVEISLISLSDEVARFTKENVFVATSLSMLLSSNEAPAKEVVDGARYFADGLISRSNEIRTRLDELHLQFKTLTRFDVN